MQTHRCELTALGDLFEGEWPHPWVSNVCPIGSGSSALAFSCAQLGESSASEAPPSHYPPGSASAVTRKLLQTSIICLQMRGLLRLFIIKQEILLTTAFGPAKPVT